MTELDIAKVIKRYNDLMISIEMGHSSIGTPYSDEITSYWNLRDMVAECDYILSTYYEDGHINGELRHSDEEEDKKLWKSETGKLKRFIKTYGPLTEGMECVSVHCGSSYDNSTRAKYYQGKTMTDEEATSFVRRTKREETWDNPIIYAKAVRVALYALGYQGHWVNGRFRDILEEEYGVEEYKRKKAQEGRNHDEY